MTEARALPPRARMALRAVDLERAAAADDSTARAQWLLDWAIWLRVRAGHTAGNAAALQASHLAQQRRETPQAQCPSCGAWVDDLDGFGVLVHDGCGYCSHPDIYGDTCTACGEVAA